MRLGICAITAVGAGCAELTSDGAAQGVGATAVIDGQLRLTFHHSDGTGEPGSVFGEKEWVYLGTWLAAGSPEFRDGELAFVVVDAHGAQVSADALDCRRFEVGHQRGRIVEVLAGVGADGAPCQHPWGYHDNGMLLPQLAPFADVPPNAQGLMEYEVRVARVERIFDGVFPEDAFRGRFFTPAPAAPACGDGHVNEGEECDDGNTTDQDGCSSACEWEVCCSGSCCGDGKINRGEDCDDGNKTSGDGCSATCKVEVIH